MSDTGKDTESIPIIDLSGDEETVAREIASALSDIGAFQITNHDVSPTLLDDIRTQNKAFFDMPHFPSKATLFRGSENSRGYLDHDYTKQRRDWKESFDIGMPGSRDWNMKDDDKRNSCLDGMNRFPVEKELPEYRSTAIKYYETCEGLAHRLSKLMVKGLGLDENIKDGVEGTEKSLLGTLKDEHSSYLRFSHYHIRPTDNETKEKQYFGIHPHSDSGWLSILLQDDDSETHQIARPENPEDWISVKPVPGSFTVLAADMCQIWSNRKYISAWNRVLTDTVKQRYSVLFFYNPGYKTIFSPCDKLVDNGHVKYKECSYGYFRAVRYAGDYEDFGTEIFVWDYKNDSKTRRHLERQKYYLQNADFTQPFSVVRYRQLLRNNS